MSTKRKTASGVKTEAAYKTTMKANDNLLQKGSQDWIKDLHRLAIRHSHLGINPDLSLMTIGEQWGVYLWLQSVGVDHG